MKNRIFIFYFLLFSITLQAQNSWEKLSQTADKLEEEEKWEEALILRKKALDLAANTDENTQLFLQAQENITRAEFIWDSLANYEETYDLMRSGVKDLITSKKAEPLKIAKVYRRLGMLAHNQFRDMKGSYSYTAKSIKYHKKSKEIDSVILSNTLHTMAVLSRELNKLEESIDYSQRVITLYEEMVVKDTNLLGRNYRDMALLYSNRFLDMPTKQYEYLSLSQKTFESTQNPDLQYLFVVYLELGLAEMDMGNYTDAEGFLNKGIHLYRDQKEKVQIYRKGKIGNAPEIVYNTYLIKLFSSLNHEKKILDALSTIENIEKHNQLDNYEYDLYVRALSLVGNFFVEKQPNKALSYFQEAERIHHKQKERDANVDITLEKATAYYYKKEYDKVLYLFESIENDSNITAYQRKRIYTLKSKIYLARNNSDKAVAEIEKLISEVSSEDFDIQTGNVKDYQVGFGLKNTRFYLDLAETLDSYPYLQSIKEKLLWLALMEFEANIGNTPLNKDLKNTFDKITSGLLHIALKRDFSTDENNRLLTFMDRVSSQEFINQYLLNREIAKNSQHFRLVEKEQYTRAYITLLKKQYQESKNDTIKQQLFEKEIELKKIDDQLAARYKSNSPFSIPNVEVSTVTNKNIIKFKVAEDDLFKIRLYKGKLSYQKIENYPKIKQDIEKYLLDINDLNIEIEELRKQGKHLYNNLFTDDFDTELPTVIIPDDILHYLPFDILVKNDNYLIEKHSISYVPNFYFLNEEELASGDSKDGKVAFFAPQYDANMTKNSLTVRGEEYSLKGAEEEVDRISKFISGEVYKGEAATKSNFKLLDKNISVLHLAMHSNLNDKDPELSNLLFSNTEQDYEMYIFELYGLNFNADLAVLSACNTGIGGFKDGENLVSMHRAFTTAGIPATVASLWNAPDQSTKELMIAFYENLQLGQNKAKALRQAKLDYLKNTKDKNLQHPFYWAGFVLSGNESPIELGNKPFWKKPVLKTIILLFIVGIGIYYRKKMR